MALLLLLARSLLSGVLNPVYWLTIVLVYRRYQREGRAALRCTCRSVLIGLASGSMGMLLTCALGLSVKVGLYLVLLFPVALILSRIRPRFCCFAYSGACVGLLNPSEASDILATVGLMHIMEAMLVAAGSMKGEELLWQEGRMRRAWRNTGYWPVPFALLIPGGEAARGILMPGWWPLLGEGTSFCLFPMTALILYQAGEKVSRSAVKLFFYGLMLLGLALWLPGGRIWQILALGVMAAAHEWILLE